MNQLTFRQLTKNDWKDICDWWRVWWRNDHTYEDMLDPKNGFFPANGEGGYIVECDGEKIVAGFLYLTNAKLACFTYMVSNYKYKKPNRRQAIDLLINGAEQITKKLGCNYIFTVTNNHYVQKYHKEAGWSASRLPSLELIKKL